MQIRASKLPIRACNGLWSSLPHINLFKQNYQNCTMGTFAWHHSQAARQYVSNCTRPTSCLSTAVNITKTESPSSGYCLISRLISTVFKWLKYSLDFIDGTTFWLDIRTKMLSSAHMLKYWWFHLHILPVHSVTLMLKLCLAYTGKPALPSLCWQVKFSCRYIAGYQRLCSKCCSLLIFVWTGDTRLWIQTPGTCKLGCAQHAWWSNNHSCNALQQSCQDVGCQTGVFCCCFAAAEAYHARNAVYMRQQSKSTAHMEHTHNKEATVVQACNASVCMWPLITQQKPPHRVKKEQIRVVSCRDAAHPCLTSTRCVLSAADASRADMRVPSETVRLFDTRNSSRNAVSLSRLTRPFTSTCNKHTDFIDCFPPVPAFAHASAR